jgi:hypothetical protein
VDPVAEALRIGKQSEGRALLTDLRAIVKKHSALRDEYKTTHPLDTEGVRNLDEALDLIKGALAEIEDAMEGRDE